MSKREKGERVNLAIFGSGAGTTASVLIAAALAEHSSYCVRLVVSSRSDSGITKVADSAGLRCYIHGQNSGVDELLGKLQENGIEMIALAGYLRLVPPEIISAVRGNILNLHPSLLPKYGGQGMYGKRVHQAVFASGESISGATVHVVTSEYDNGPIVDQQSCYIGDCSTVEEVEVCVRKIEKPLYCRAVQMHALKLAQSKTN